MGRGPSIAGRKNAQDAKRGQVFTKLVREIMVAARIGGGDVNGNARLRSAVDKAIAASMPKDNIDRAIKKATGELEGVTYEELHFEGYAPGGIAVLVECLTDNRQRTISDVRHAFAKFGGNLGTDGSVAYLFNKIGVLSYAGGADEEKITDAAIEAGAEDVVVNADTSIAVLTDADSFESVREAMQAAGLKPENAEITLRADNMVAVSGEHAEQVTHLLEWLEELDDVQDVYSNAALPRA
jgi:YebC/PmpR family DNA-binding regulatory protein